MTEVAAPKAQRTEVRHIVITAVGHNTFQYLKPERVNLTGSGLWVEGRRGLVGISPATELSFPNHPVKVGNVTHHFWLAPGLSNKFRRRLGLEVDSFHHHYQVSGEFTENLSVYTLFARALCAARKQQRRQNRRLPIWQRLFRRLAA